MVTATLAIFAAGCVRASSADPEQGTGGLPIQVTSKDGKLYPVANISRGDTMVARFGAPTATFSHAAPSGFSAGWYQP